MHSMTPWLMAATFPNYCHLCHLSLHRCSNCGCWWLLWGSFLPSILNRHTILSNNYVLKLASNSLWKLQYLSQISWTHSPKYEVYTHTYTYYTIGNTTLNFFMISIIQSLIAHVKKNMLFLHVTTNVMQHHLCTTNARVVNMVKLIVICQQNCFFAYTRPMMTSSNGNIFSITGPLCGEFTGDKN